MLFIICITYSRKKYNEYKIYSVSCYGYCGYRLAIPLSGWPRNYHWLYSCLWPLLVACLTIQLSVVVLFGHTAVCCLPYSCLLPVMWLSVTIACCCLVLCLAGVTTAGYRRTSNISWAHNLLLFDNLAYAHDRARTPNGEITV